MIEIMVLLACALIMLVVGAAFWRYPATQWFEKQVPLLFPGGIARNLEAIACSRPINHFGIHFLMFLGAFTLVRDIGGSDLSLFLRYTMALMVAAFTLVLARRSASMRADQRAT